MEPLPIGSGNCPNGGACAPQRCGFNGATANRQWELDRPQYKQSTLQGFNGATANRQWELSRVRNELGLVRIASMEPLPIGSGNRPAERMVAVHEPASMEPLPIGSGNCPSRRTSTWSRPCFNGATANRQWERQTGR